MCGAAAAGDFIPTRGGAACRTDGATIAIGHTMAIGLTGRIIMAAGTIHIGVTGIGTVTDPRLETNHLITGIKKLIIPL